MLDSLRRKQPATTLKHLLFYESMCFAFRLASALFYRAKVFDKHLVPASGPLILASNHQSNLDPPLIGIRLRQRHLTFIAKSGLFRFKPFAAAIAFLNALPINDTGGDLAAIKETITRLNTGSAILIFPEGSRCSTGEIESYKRGVALLVAKARCPVVPVAIEGAFDAWPHTRLLPRLFGCRVYVKYGQPIPYDELMQNGPQAALSRLRLETDRMRLELRALLRAATQHKFPPKGPSDNPLAIPTPPPAPTTPQPTQSPAPA